MKDNDHVLHIGAGNSLLAEQILNDSRSPSKLKITNIDISPVAVDRMNDHLNSLFGDESDTESRTRVATRGKKKPNNKRKSNASDLRFTRDQICYLLGDVTDLQYESSSIDVVLDKGMLDAVLSHGEVETGENQVVKKVNSEVYRVLKDGGYYIIISGMDSFLTLPYFVGDENVSWDYSHKSFQSRSPSNKTLRTLFFYVLKANKSEN